MKKIVALTGAGISAESGLRTFRGAGGLWEGYDIMEVASPEGWQANPALVLKFYNERRIQLKSAFPNAAHLALAALEKKFDVQIITQNVDDLHERAGSSNVLHLHGELRKVRSTGDPSLVYETDGEINLGDTCEKGYQLRPHIVWFGELVPDMEKASRIAASADIFLVIGTSLAVYPAAGLIDYTKRESKKYLIDPEIPSHIKVPNLLSIAKKAGEGLPELVKELMK